MSTHRTTGRVNVPKDRDGGRGSRQDPMSGDQTAVLPSVRETLHEVSSPMGYREGEV